MARGSRSVLMALVGLGYPSDDKLADIGDFIVGFSELEGTVKLCIWLLARFPDDLFDEIVAPYDFATACTVLAAVARKRMPEDAQKRLAMHIARARKINDERVRVAHGKWVSVGDRFFNRHISRQRLVASDHFEDSAELRGLAEEAQHTSLDIFQEVHGFAGSPDGYQ